MRVDMTNGEGYWCLEAPACLYNLGFFYHDIKVDRYIGETYTVTILIKKTSSYLIVLHITTNGPIMTKDFTRNDSYI